MALKNSLELQPYVVEDVSKPTTQQHLGSGSYGTVEQFLISGLKCAGKTLHKNLFNIEMEGSESFTNKFVAECKLMTNLRHPNVVQFLGIFFSDTDEDLPVVLMELMPTSLQSVIETYPNFSLSLKQSILKDVACGMSYLHGRSPPVIHRDLTATNVLMSAAMVAKISDFGNSRIVTISPDQLQKTMTSVPGTPVYLPPEAFEPQPSYNSKLDVFSFGQIALYTIVQEFPSPTNATVLDPSTKALIAVSEVQRRQICIDKLDPLVSSRPVLKELILSCLDNDPDQRPASLEIFNILDKVCSEYEGPYINMTRMDLLTALKEQGNAKTETQSSVAPSITLSERALEFENAYRAKDKVLEAREEENALQVQLIAKLQEEIKSKEIGQEKVLEMREKEFEVKIQDLQSKVTLLESQKVTFSGLCESKEKVIHTKEEENKELVKVIEGFKEQVFTDQKVLADSGDSKLTSLQQKLNTAKLQIDGWERLCQARNQQLEEVSKEKQELEEEVRKRLEQLGEDINIEELTSEIEEAQLTASPPVTPTCSDTKPQKPVKSGPEPQPKQSKGGSEQEGKRKKKKSKIKPAVTRPHAACDTPTEPLADSPIQHVKIVIVGDGAAGKTCLLITYTTNSYPQAYVPTVFDNYSTKVIIEGKPWDLALWDTAGQDDYDRLRPLSYPHTDCFIILFSVYDPSTLANAEDKWYPEIFHHQPKVPFILVGNKIDLRRDPGGRKMVTYAQGKAVADKLGAAAYVECSAKEFVGVKEVFDNVIHAVLNSTKRTLTRDKSNCVIQ